MGKNATTRLATYYSPIEFIRDLEKKLWTTADKLRSNLDAAFYKHVVLGVIFLTYVSDARQMSR